MTLIRTCSASARRKNWRMYCAMPKRRRLPNQIRNWIFRLDSPSAHAILFLRISRCVFLNSQPGGSALNTSKILSMLGEMNVVFCGMIGADSNGELIQKKLANCHLNVWWVKWPSPTIQMRWHSIFISIYRRIKFSAGVRLLMHSWWIFRWSCDWKKYCTRSQPFGWWVGSLVALDTCAACTQYT